MPIVTSTEMFKKAYEGGYAIGAFNVNNMEIYKASPRLPLRFPRRLFSRFPPVPANTPSTSI